MRQKEANSYFMKLRAAPLDYERFDKDDAKGQHKNLNRKIIFVAIYK